jgi:hypothetical protein
MNCTGRLHPFKGLSLECINFLNKHGYINIIWWKYVLYENEKMRSVETILRGGENDGVGEFNKDISTFVNATMYPQYNSNTIKICIWNIYVHTME